MWEVSVTLNPLLVVATKIPKKSDFSKIWKQGAKEGAGDGPTTLLPHQYTYGKTQSFTKSKFAWETVTRYCSFMRDSLDISHNL